MEYTIANSEMANEKEAQLYTCQSCGKKYIVRKCEAQYFAKGSDRYYCVPCRKAFRAKLEREREEQENLTWQRKKAEGQKLFESLLPAWNLKDLSEIKLSSKDPLFIIGNGFDLMHGVKSSYYTFRDSLGKNSSLRTWLESFWTPEDIWADLEDGLAHFDMNAMGGRFMVDNWLDVFDAYDEDASAASFLMAAEAAASPMIEVSTELPKRFRRWIETLAIGTDDRPLRNILTGGKVLNFNYTEFVETLYGIPADHICYIHGCRKEKNGRLILGHRPEASESSYELNEKQKRRRATYRSSLIEAAQEQVFRIVSNCDQELSKDCASILKAHEGFFHSLKGTREIVVIGHSMSQVDWDYFKAIVSELDPQHAAVWYFGCHGLNDLKNLEALIRFLELKRDHVILFRTDTIRVNFEPQVNKPQATKSAASRQARKKRILAESADKKWAAEFCESTLNIMDLKQKQVSYEALISPYVRNAFFDEEGKNLFVIIRGIYPGVLLFSRRDGRWTLINELEGIPNQGVLNKRLKKVFLNRTHITFVYNNRVRRYNLSDGLLAENCAVRNASARDYTGEGTDVSRRFLR